MDGELVKSLLASNIRSARGKLKLTQQQLAERVGSSTSFIGEIEIRRKFPSPANIERIASALGMQPYELFIDENREGPNRDQRELLSVLKNDLQSSISKDIDDIIFKYLSE